MTSRQDPLDGEPPLKKNPWWKPTKQERADLAPLSSALTALSLALALVQLYVHDATVALVLSAALAVVVPTALILIRRMLSRRVKLRVSVIAAGACVAVLAGIGIGLIIGHYTESSGHSPVSAPTTTATAQTHQPSSPLASSPPPSGPPPSQSPSSPLVTSGARGTFTTPAAGIGISDGYLNASGTVQNLPHGYRLDLFLKVAYLSVYYAAGDPNSQLTITGGKWSGQIFIGSQGPTAVYIYLVELSPASVQLMNREYTYQSAGYPSVTALGTVLAVVRLNLS